MGRYGFRVVDADGHIMEPSELYESFLERHMDPQYRPALRSRMDEAASKKIRLWECQSRVPRARTSRQLGVADQKEDLQRIPTVGTAKAGMPGRMWEPKARLEDMDLEGVDVSVIFPSAMSSFCAWEDKGLEAAMYQAYHRALAEYCHSAPERLKWVAIISMRDIERGLAELHRVAEDRTMVGVYMSGHMDDTLLDSPTLHPIWEAAQAYDLPILVHGGTARPPYGIGTFEMGDSLFIQHSSTNPFEQMRAMAALIGGGVLDRFPRLRVAFLEAGVGWVPFYLDRLDEHAELMPKYVPGLKRKPSDIVRAGSQCFISCDPDETTLAYAVQAIGEDHVLYASDYPHFDARFPNTVRLIAEHPGLTASAKQKILGGNALKLYPRIEA